MQENNQQETKRSAGLCRRELDPPYSVIHIPLYVILYISMWALWCWRFRPAELLCWGSGEATNDPGSVKIINMLQKPKVSVELWNLVTTDEIWEAAEVSVSSGLSFDNSVDHWALSGQTKYFVFFTTNFIDVNYSV